MRGPLITFFLVGFASCFSPEPAPACRVVSTSDFLNHPPYIAKLTQTARASTCTDAQLLKSMRLGAEHFIPPTGEAAQLVLRPARLVDMVEGRVFAEAQRPIRRVDSDDPNGKKLNARGTFAARPIAGVCTAEKTVAQQHFDAVTVRQPDGGTVDFPALTVKFEFSEVRVMATPEVPGTAFTGKLGQTEGSCTASYDLLAVYPALACTKDDDCAAGLDVDAGRTRSNGMSPWFQPICDADLGFCMPSVDVTKAGLPKL